MRYLSLPYGAGLRCRLSLLGVALLWLCIAGAARAQAGAPVTVLIDGSGSMRGFFRTGAMSELVAKVRQIAASDDRAVTAEVFVSRAAESGVRRVPLESWPTDARSKEFGDVTRLDVLVGELQPGTTYVIVTDNFQDEGEAIGRTGRFYAQLHGAALSRVYLAPALLPFDGAAEFAPGAGIAPGPAGTEALQAQIKQATDVVFLGPEGRIDRPEWRTSKEGIGYWHVGYRGQRGMAIYLLQTQGSKDLARSFDRWVRRGAGLDATPLLIHPLGEGAVRLQASAEARPDPKAMRCAGLTEAELPTPNLGLKVDAKRRYSLGLLPDRKHSYDPRRAHKFVAALEVVTTDAHVRLAATGECQTAARLRVSPLQVTVPEARHGILLPEDQRRPSSEARPAHLVGSLDPKAKAARSVFLVLDLPALVGPQVEADALRGGLEARLDLDVVVPRSAWQMAPEVRRRYFTESPLDLARIFSPGDLVQVLAPKDVTLRLPVRVESEVVNSHEEEVPPTELPWGAILGVLGTLAALGGLWGALKPLGFDAPLRCEPAVGCAVPVSGLLKKQPGTFGLPTDAAGAASAVTLERASAFGTRLRVLQKGGIVGELAPGQQLDLGHTALRYLTSDQVKHLKAGGLFK